MNRDEERQGLLEFGKCQEHQHSTGQPTPTGGLSPGQKPPWTARERGAWATHIGGSPEETISVLTCYCLVRDRATGSPGPRVPQSSIQQPPKSTCFPPGPSLSRLQVTQRRQEHHTHYTEHVCSSRAHGT